MIFLTLKVVQTRAGVLYSSFLRGIGAIKNKCCLDGAKPVLALGRFLLAEPRLVGS